MTSARIVGAAGKVFIALGVVILLFATFQLWGTGVIEARAQQQLDQDFDNLLEESQQIQAPSPPPEPSPTTEPAEPAEADPQATPTTEPSSSEPEPTPTTEPIPADTASSSTPPEVSQAWLDILYRDQGAAIAHIIIPEINVDKTVVEGVRVNDLRKGPGHYTTTPLPGQAGNAAIAGHRTTYGSPFGAIDQLVPGNQIFIETIQGSFIYQVVAQEDGKGHFIVSPNAVEVLDQNFPDHPNRLTLTACHPKGSARQRIIVVAELIGNPAPTYPRSADQIPQTPALASENLNTVTPLPEETPETTDAPPPEVEQPEAEPTTATEPEPDAEAVASETATAAPTTPASDDDQEEAALPISSGNQPDEAAGFSMDDSRGFAAPTQANSGFGAGLDGDSSALTPAILWGLATAMVWLSAIFVGQRWKKLPSYAAFTIPLLVVMFAAFWHIDRVIPSY